MKVLGINIDTIPQLELIDFNTVYILYKVIKFIMVHQNLNVNDNVSTEDTQPFNYLLKESNIKKTLYILY